MISIVIPTYNEALVIKERVIQLFKSGSGHIAEIIVADGGSSDETCRLAHEGGAVVVRCSQKGRAAQMNEGASGAIGEILYFLHADSVPPSDFSLAIIKATDDSYVAGCFRLQFDFDHWFLNSQSWFTRFDFDPFRYGDQSLFVTKTAFRKIHGFDKHLILFEDNEIIKRLKRIGKFAILSQTLLTSARKYQANGIIKTQLVFYLLFIMYKLDFTQPSMIRVFRSLLKKDKI